jgi:hypothetical protein
LIFTTDAEADAEIVYRITTEAADEQAARDQVELLVKGDESIGFEILESQFESRERGSLYE